ncbi:peptide chain release factor N(5)-glutamine methyltransferase [Verrucomicrobiaceae bacterium N1E253]|uniref:Release factor glutamine methyltransferase n=1 Tax=Oceaniferula marina TaxID=2748318 RepID=A0A851GKE1_9BACT|nr:HemK/PrmC family methyltransferase [Oceaniferula marina]NWK54634.1 peptide chain release factor N(5)-glutamine methyltransferase [Oceaniferula marina]
MSLTTVLDTIEKGTIYLENKGIDDARRNMQLLVMHQLGCSRVELYMQFDRPMEESELTPLREQLLQRGRGVPLQHLLGTVEFYRREFKTDARALIPRPETEELADILLKHPELQAPPLSEPEIPAPSHLAETDTDKPEGSDTAEEPEPSTDDQRLRILDMGTGTGVLGLTLAAEFSGRCQEVLLADISKEALSLAKENTELLGTPRYQLIQTDLFSQLQGEQFHLIVANLPYIPESDRDSLSSEVMNDPTTALFGGKDGLDIIRDFIQQAPSHLHPGGMIALEIGYDQAPEVESLLQQRGFQSIQTHQDLNQVSRFPIAIFP